MAAPLFVEVTTIPNATNESENESDPEEDLVRRAWAGERAAFSVLAGRHRAGIAGRHRAGIAALARRALKNADDAQDVAQETFLYVFQRLGDLRDPSRFGPWLRSVTLSLCADFRRRRATRPLILGASWHTDTIAAAERDLAQSLVLRGALGRLSNGHRLTFTLAHVGGYTHEEIACLLNVPVNTVRSRLQTAKRLLRAQLHDLDTATTRKTMPATTRNASGAKTALPAAYEELIRATLPGARIVAVEREPETWMPFAWRVRLALPDGTERSSVDVRSFASILSYYDGAPAPNADLHARLFAALKRLGLPLPELLAGPMPDPENEGSLVALTATPRGENLLTWALEGSLPHRIRAATNLTIAAIDQLHGLTEGLLADPVAAELPRRPLSLDLSEIVEKGGPWLSDPLFADAVKRLTPLVEKTSESTPLVYTNDLYFPNFLRVAGGAADFSEAAPFGWPGDPRGDAGRAVTEFVQPFGWFGDPVLGLAKFWTYDCYPFVHTGLVERYLYEKGTSKAQFAPRLAVRALWTLQRELLVSRPAEGAEYWDSQIALLKHALDSLDG